MNKKNHTNFHQTLYICLLSSLRRLTKGLSGRLWQIHVYLEFEKLFQWYQSFSITMVGQLNWCVVIGYYSLFGPWLFRLVPFFRKSGPFLVPFLRKSDPFWSLLLATLVSILNYTELFSDLNSY